jgi:carbonic anhydrase
LRPIKFSYRAATVPVEDTGHTIEANFGAGSASNSVTYAGKTYNLLQFHFHQPNEHSFLNWDAPTMEAHLVHKAADGSMLVVAVMMTTGTASQGNPTFGTVLANIEKTASVNPDGMLPSGNHSKLNYFVYTGSLTTPPCSPNITWLVLAKPITISADQYKSFGSHYTGNARPVQKTLSPQTVQKSNIPQ